MNQNNQQNGQQNNNQLKSQINAGMQQQNSRVVLQQQGQLQNQQQVQQQQIRQQQSQQQTQQRVGQVSQYQATQRVQVQSQQQYQQQIRQQQVQQQSQQTQQRVGQTSQYQAQQRVQQQVQQQVQSQQQQVQQQTQQVQQQQVQQQAQPQIIGLVQQQTTQHSGQTQSVQTPTHQSIRQRSQEEAKEQAQNIQLSQEELQKTQVLNLNDVENAAKMERFTSKKPAIVAVSLAVILLTFGFGFNYINGMKSPKTTERVVQRRETNNTKDSIKNIDNTTTQSVLLNCSKTTNNNADGTDTIFTIAYEFVDDKLVGFTKTFDITKTPGNPLGDTTVQNYLTAYQSFLNPMAGYQITLTPKVDGLTTNVDVKYANLNIEQLNPVQQTHFSTSIDFQEGALKSEVQTSMQQQGFMCK